MIMNNPYEILNDVNLISKYEKKLGIEDVEIFKSVLRGNDKIDIVLGSMVTKIIGAFNPFGVIGWLKLQKVKIDSRNFISEQLLRLQNAPERFDEELSMNLIVFACMGFEMKCAIDMNKGMSNIAPEFASWFSSDEKRQKWLEIQVSRLIEVVRWCYSSSILMIIHYMMICERKCIEYDLSKLKSAARYIAKSLYYGSDDIGECFINGYEKLLSDNYQYIHDILLDYESPILMYGSINNPSEVSKDVFEYYASGDNRKSILEHIERRITT